MDYRKAVELKWHETVWYRLTKPIKKLYLLKKKKNNKTVPQLLPKSCCV